MEISLCNEEEEQTGVLSGGLRGKVISHARYLSVGNTCHKGDATFYLCFATVCGLHIIKKFRHMDYKNGKIVK